MSDLSDLVGGEESEVEVEPVYLDKDTRLPSEVLKPAALGSLQPMLVGDVVTTFNILIYGDSGVGKTRLAASASAVEEMCPVLAIDIEGGLTSIKHLYPNVAVQRVRSWDEMQEAYNALYEDAGQNYKTVIVDSLTETQKFSMYGVMKQLIEEEPTRDPDIPSLREWGKNIEQMRKFIRAFRDLPINTIFTALRMDDRNTKTGQVTTLPSLSGKLAREAAAFLDEVLYYYIKATTEEGVYERLLLTAKTEEVVAKDRSDALPMIVENPTMEYLFKTITHQQ
jgi:hypothetical protein